MKYLIVDDSRMGRRSVEKVLKEHLTENDEILFAVNGVEAVEIYKEHNPDFCFMDLTMPIMDGFEATLEIKKFDENAKIVIVSAEVQAGAKAKAMENGALGFIKKPINSNKMELITIMLEEDN